jgi:RNA polymerase sigma-70 factor (ECF subfamily)
LKFSEWVHLGQSPGLYPQLIYSFCLILIYFKALNLIALADTVSYSADDKQLLSLLSKGDKTAFEQIYQRYWEPLYNSAYKRLKNTDQCKDILQDVFVDLWARRGKVEIENLGAYLHTAIRFQIYKLAAKEKATPVFIELFESISTHSFNADSNIEYKEIENLFRAWLDTLPEKRRQIFLMHYVENLSTREIAERLQISQKTVQNQLGSASDSLYSDIIPAVLVILSANQIFQ